MSFYQPTLSIYDILQALSSQAQAGRPPRREVPLQGQAPYAVPPSYGDRYYGAYGRPFGRNIPSHHYRRVLPQPYYYRPNYYYVGEDQEGDDEEEEGEAEEEEDEEEEHKDYPGDLSHDEKQSYDGGFRNVEDATSPYESGLYQQSGDSLKDLLTSMFGVPQPSSADRNSVDRQTVDTKQISKDAADEKEEAPKKSKPELLKRRSSSFLHHAIPSAAAPLQVSKPETRINYPFSPDTNVYNCPEDYTIVLALPGASSNTFEIDYHPSSHELIIRGKIEDKMGIEERYLKVNELKYGAFERTVKFPVVPRIKDEEIKAKYRNGILHIKVPKLAPGSEKPIPKKSIIIEDVPDEELEFEKHPGN